MDGRRQPERSFDEGLQHERTAMAWERTSIATMVAGTVLARYAAGAGAYVFVALGLAHAAFGAALLVWAGTHYESLHERLRAGESPAHPQAARVVGTVTMVATALALVVAVAIALG